MKTKDGISLDETPNVFISNLENGGGEEGERERGRLFWKSRNLIRADSYRDDHRRPPYRHPNLEDEKMEGIRE